MRPGELGRHGAPRFPAAGPGGTDIQGPGDGAALSPQGQGRPGGTGLHRRRGPGFVRQHGAPQAAAGHSRTTGAEGAEELSGASLPQEHLYFLTHGVSPTEPQLAQPQALGPLGTSHTESGAATPTQGQFGERPDRVPSSVRKPGTGNEMTSQKTAFLVFVWHFLFLCKHQVTVFLKREMRRWKLFSQVGWS